MVAVEEWGDQLAAIQTRTAALETGKADVSLVQHLEELLSELRLRVGALEKRCGAPANFEKEAAQAKEEEEPKERVEKEKAAEGDSAEANTQSRPKGPRSAWEQVARARAAKEETQKKEQEASVQENGEKPVPAEEDEAAVRAKAAAEETARKKAAQDEAVRKRAAQAQAEAERKKAAEAAAAEEERKAAEQEAAARAKAVEEELAKKKAAQEEGQRKRAAEEESAARAKAAEEEVARKKAAQEEASRKRAAEVAAAEEQASRAAAAEEEAARKKVAQEESKRKQLAEAESAKADSGEQERAARTLAAEEEAARKRVAQEEAMRKRGADRAPPVEPAQATEEAEAQKRAAEEERARKRAAAVESARKKAAEQEAPQSDAKDAQDAQPQAASQPAPQPNGVSPEAEEEGVKPLTAEEVAAARKAADTQRKQRMAQAMARTRQVFEQSAAARKAAQEKSEKAQEEEPEKKEAEKKAEEDVPGAEVVAAKRAAEEQAKQRAIDEKKEEDKNLDDEVLSASEEGDDLPDLCGADGTRMKEPAQAGEARSVPDEPKEKKIDYSRFDEIEDSDEEKVKKEKVDKDDDIDDAEETGLKSAKNPFPDELEATELAAKAAGGVEAASAALSYAELLLSCARYEEARKAAVQARELFQEREGLESKAMGEAGAVKLVVKILLEEEKFSEAQQMANEHFQEFSKTGNEKAAAVAQLALADVYLALDRPGEALKVAKQAQETFKRMEDNIWVAKVLQTTAMVNMKKGTPSCLKTALKEAEEGMSYFSIVGDTKEEAATLVTISKTHMLRQEFQDAFTKADKAASLCRDAGHKKGEAAALREVTNALVQLKEEHEVALQAAMEALELSEEIGDPLGEISSRQILASIYVQSNVAESAEKSLNIALEAARILKERRTIKAVLEQVVQVQLNGGNTDKALAAIQKEVKLAGQSGDPRRQLAAYQTLATIQVALSKQDEAMETANEAVKLGGDSEDKKIHAWALQLVAEVHMQSERFQEALAENEKARAILRELNDVKEVAGTWSLTITVQQMMNNMQGAVSSKTELRNLFKEAGWKDEEAAELLNIAELHQRVKGPREAVKIAKEAVTLYQEMGDKVGEATAVAQLAMFQAAGRSFTDALSTMRNARRLFQTEGDVNGEVNVLLQEGNIYFENGRADEAIKVITEGKDLSQTAGEKKAEAECLRLISQMRTEEVKKEVMTGRKPSQKPFEEALASVQELVEILRQMGDLENQVEALFQLSGLHAMNKDEEALEIAQEALSITMKLDEAGKVGTALLAICDAQQAQDNHSEAAEAALEASNQFQAAGDEQNAEMARQVAEACKQAAQAPKAPAVKPGASNGSSPNFMESRGLSDRLKNANARMPQPGGGRGPHAEVQNPMTQKKSFAFTQTQLGEKPYGTPDQERRRQQLSSASEAHAQPPRFQADDAAPGAGLREVLHSVRPDWTTKDLHSVQEKLTKINVSTSAELFRLLRSQGAGGVNKMLKNAGQKILKIETLQALQDRANE